MKLAGVKLVVRRAPGFDPARTCFLLINHVNLFDPFVLYATVPQFFRGLELESHFRIPVYGWMMKRFGNVPVPDVNRPSDLKRMWRLTRAALDSGVSLAVFPEGQRTLDGRVGPFKDGVFRMALQFGTPIVPVSVVGSFEFNKKTSWLIRPGTVTVYLHDVIETKDLRKEDFPALRDRVHAIIAGPIDEAHASAEKQKDVASFCLQNENSNMSYSERRIPGSVRPALVSCQVWRIRWMTVSVATIGDHPERRRHAVEQSAEDQQDHALGTLHEADFAKRNQAIRRARANS